MSEIDFAVGAIGALALIVEDVEIVAADAAHDLGPALDDLAAMTGRQFPHELRQRCRAAGERVERPEVRPGAVREPGADAEHVVHHVAVGDGARPAGIVSRHAAQGRLRTGRYIDRKPQAVRSQAGVQVIEDQPRLDYRDPVRRVDVEYLPDVLAVVDHQSGADRLAALAGAAAARYHRYAQIAGDVEGGAEVGVVGWDEDAGRHDLIDRRVGGVATAGGFVEKRLAARFPAKPALEFLDDIGRRRFGTSSRRCLAPQGIIHSNTYC